jgi:nucleoid-associated protein YgaU
VPVRVPPGQVRLWSADETLTLTCLLGDTAPKVTAGPRVETVEREGARPLTAYRGATGMRAELALMIEDVRVPTGGTTRDKVRVLEKMAGVDRGDPEPPALFFQANLPHHDYNRAPQNEWIIESPPEWDEALYSNRAVLLRQPVAITLVLRTESDVNRLRKTAPFKSQTMRRGETLRDFAKRVLGDARRWQTIQSLNRTDPRCPTSPAFKVGRNISLRVPPREPVRERRGR